MTSSRMSENKDPGAISKAGRQVIPEPSPYDYFQIYSIGKSFDEAKKQVEEQGIQEAFYWLDNILPLSSDSDLIFKNASQEYHNLVGLFRGIEKATITNKINRAVNIAASVKAAVKQFSDAIKQIKLTDVIDHSKQISKAQQLEIKKAQQLLCLILSIHFLLKELDAYFINLSFLDNISNKFFYTLFCKSFNNLTFQFTPLYEAIIIFIKNNPVLIDHLPKDLPGEYSTDFRKAGIELDREIEEEEKEIKEQEKKDYVTDSADQKPAEILAPLINTEMQELITTRNGIENEIKKITQNQNNILAEIKKLNETKPTNVIDFTEDEAKAIEIIRTDNLPPYNESLADTLKLHNQRAVWEGFYRQKYGSFFNPIATFNWFADSYTESGQELIKIIKQIILKNELAQKELEDQNKKIVSLQTELDTHQKHALDLNSQLLILNNQIKAKELEIKKTEVKFDTSKEIASQHAPEHKIEAAHYHTQNETTNLIQPISKVSTSAAYTQISEAEEVNLNPLTYPISIAGFTGIGTAIGAMIGSVVPVIGTLIGLGVGGGIGLIIGCATYAYQKHQQKKFSTPPRMTYKTQTNTEASFNRNTRDIFQDLNTKPSQSYEEFPKYKESKTETRLALEPTYTSTSTRRNSFS